MNETTQFISQLTGPMLIILGLSFVLNKGFYLRVFKNLESEWMWVITFALLETLAWITILINHHLFWSIFEIIVTLVAYWFIMEWTVMLLWLRKYLQWVTWFITPNLIWMWAYFCIVIGVFLSWAGYFWG